MKRKLLNVLAIVFAFSALTAFSAISAAKTVKADGETTTTTYSVNNLALNMQAGASVKIAESTEDAGIKFSMTMPKAEYDWLIASKEGETAIFSEVTFGILVAPKTYHAKYALNSEANVLGDARKYGWLKGTETDWATSEDGTSGLTLARIINIENDVMVADATDADLMRFDGSVVKMLTANLTTEYVGAGYIRYTTVAEGETLAETHYVFADFASDDYARSMTYVAQCAIADEATTTEDKAFLTDSYVNVESVKATASEYYIDYYLRNASGEYVKDDTLTQTVTSTVGAEVNVTYDTLNTVQGYIFNENFNSQLEDFTVFANNRTPHVRVNMEGAVIADFENATVSSDIWNTLNPNGGTFELVNNVVGLEEFGKMFKLNYTDDWKAAPLAKWTNAQIKRAKAAGYTYLKADVCYSNPEKTDTAWVTLGKTPKGVPSNSIYKMATVSVSIDDFDDNSTAASIAFNITDQKYYDIYLDNVRFGTDELPTVEYLYNRFEGLDSLGSSIYAYEKCSLSLVEMDGSQVVKLEATEDGANFGLVHPTAGGWVWTTMFGKYAGKTLKFKIYLTEASWVNVGQFGKQVDTSSNYYSTLNTWIEVSVSIDAIANQESNDWVMINVNNARTCYIDDIRIV